MLNQGKWIYVGCNHWADVMPTEDCEIWIARGGCGKGWIQKVPYYAQNGQFDWDGIYAYQQVVGDEKPEPYIMKFVNETIVCEKII